MEFIQDYGNSSLEGEDEMIGQIVEETATVIDSHNDSGDDETYSSEPSSSSKITKKAAKKQNTLQRQKESHSVINEICKCSRSCHNKIGSDQRLTINQSYWNKDFSGQKSFVQRYVIECPVKRRRSASEDAHVRTKMFKYHLPSEGGAQEEICGGFFLNTLGYKKGSG